MSQQSYLTQYGLMAEKHWREILTENGAAARNGGTADGGAVGGAGDDTGRNGNAHPEAGAGATIDTRARADDGVGISAGEVYSPAAREPERLNDRVRVDGLSRRPCSAAEDSIRRSKRSGLVQRAVQGVGGADEE